jgi:hypothetical protein
MGRDQAACRHDQPYRLEAARLYQCMGLGLADPISQWGKIDYFAGLCMS